MHNFRLAVLIPLLLGGALGLSSRTTRATAPYTITDLGAFMPGAGSYAYGINNRGQVVGYAWGQRPNGQLFEGSFLYEPRTDKMLDLGTLPGGGLSTAYGVDDRGDVVGSAYDRAERSRAFLYADGTISDLGTFPGGVGFGATAVSGKRGLVVGAATGTETLYAAEEMPHAFVYDPRTRRMSDLGTLPGDVGSSASGVNDRGEVVGSSAYQYAVLHAFEYSHGVMLPLGTLPTGTYSVATAINDSGQVVGYSGSMEYEAGCLNDYIQEVDHAFVYQHGIMTPLNVAGRYDDICDSQAAGINREGQIVGEAGGHAFVYTNGTELDLQQTVGAAAGWRLLTATGINDRGQIVGYGLNPQRIVDAFLLTPAG